MRRRASMIIVFTILGVTVTASAVAQQFDPALYEALEWRSIGPARGGRSTAAAGSDARPLEYYFGATGGGLWKSTDAGQTWRPVTDDQVNSASVGAVQVCEADPDVVYIGMGETQLRGNIQQGDGVYKSTDGGETWRHMGLAATQNISRIRIHPNDCNTVWVAALGVHSAPNPDRGIFKSTNGGETWQKVLYRDENTGGVDLTLDPSNPAIMYAALWEAFRKSWGMSSGGPGGGLFKSTDFGETWTEITRNPGLPQAGLIGKIGVALSPAAPHRVWAIVENDDGGVFRSDDAGATWTKVNEERRLRQRAFYYTRLYADPQDPDVMYVLNTGLYRSRDGGETYQGIRVPHGDNHDLWIAPSDPNRMINANDGGANVSYNGGQSWTDQDYPTAQFYRVTTTHHEPYFICGGQQDNSTACIASKGWNHLAARGGGNYFYSAGGCESGYVANDPKDPDIYYAGCYGGSLSRYNHRNGQRRAINVWPENPMGQSSEDLIERVQWTFPIVFSPVDPNRLYTGTQKVWVSTNEGHSWQQLSEDLTRATPETMGPSGGPITKDQTGVETYATVFAIAPSYHDVDVIWAGSDDGYVHVTQDGGQNWRNVTPRDAPDLIRINTIEASPNTPGKAYVSGIRYLVDNDRSPYVWKTTDFGQTWTKIVNGIPGDDFVRAVREDPMRPGLLYAASERTVYVSWDDGDNWQPLTQNLPTVQVSDLVVEENDLVISTHGRSFWVMYNIAPLRQLTPQVAEAETHLFDPVDPVRGIDFGVAVVYYIADDVDTLKLEFLDSSGEVIQTYTGTPSDRQRPQQGGGFGGFGFGGGNRQPSATAGSHTFTWNMRYPAWKDFEGRIFWAAGPIGPRAVPGQYQVRITAGDVEQTRDFQIKLDPRVEAVTIAQLQERFDLALQIRDRVTEANEAVIQIRDVKKEVDDRLEKTDDSGIEEQGETVKTKMSAVEQEIYQVRNESNQDPLNFPIKLNNKIAALMGTVEGGEAEPTEQSREVYEHLSGLLQVELDRLQVIINTDLRRLNELLQENGLDPIVVSDQMKAAGVSP